MNEAFAIQGYSMANTLLCYIKGSDIVQTDYLGQQKVIGKTQAAYAELEATTTEYYNKLVELGVIVPEKTPEEQMQQMQQAMTQMAALIQNLTNEVKEMKGYEHAADPIGGKGVFSEQAD